MAADETSIIDSARVHALIDHTLLTPEATAAHVDARMQEALELGLDTVRGVVPGRPLAQALVSGAGTP